MYGRQRFSSVPTEILRSVVSIDETGSISKAARMLGISQPAISAQMKRIEDLVGGGIFTKSANGSISTDLGKLVLIQARKILEANRQMLLLRGARDEHRGLKLGLSDHYARAALNALKNSRLDDVSIVVNCSIEIMKGLLNGYIDLGLFLLLPELTLDPSINVLSECTVDMAWVRAKDFVLSPGAPIPLLTWGGQISHQLMVNALERKGLIYRIAFSSPDPQARIEAAERGLGLTALPISETPASLMEARGYYLPPLQSAKLYLCLRKGGDTDHDKLRAVLQDCLFQPMENPTHKLAG